MAVIVTVSGQIHPVEESTTEILALWKQGVEQAGGKVGLDVLITLTRIYNTHGKATLVVQTRNIETIAERA